MQLYTGSHWRVEAATLADVEHFTKFAVSTQGLAAYLSHIPEVTLLPSLGECPSSLLLIHTRYDRFGQSWMLESQNARCMLQTGIMVFGAAMQGPTFLLSLTVLQTGVYGYGSSNARPNISSKFDCAADWNLWLRWQQRQQHLGSPVQEPHPRKQGGQGPAKEGHPQQVRGSSMPEGSHQAVEL